MRTLYFEGSKTQDDSRTSILIDPLNKRYILSCHLEFKYMNNIVEYEALILGLTKSINIKVEVLNVIGDSNTVTRKKRNTIHCVSNTMKNYQQEVWKPISFFK